MVVISSMVVPSSMMDLTLMNIFSPVTSIPAVKFATLRNETLSGGNNKIVIEPFDL